MKTMKRLPAFLGAMVCAPAVFAEMGINFPEPATDGAREIYDIHMLTMTITTVLLVLVFAFVIYSLIVHRKSKGYPADQHFHETWFGKWSWVLVPAMVLGVDLTIAGSAQTALEKLWVIPKDDNMLVVKVIGHQWWWEFQYLDEGIKVESRYVPKEQAGDLYLREVDNRLVLPTNRKIRFLHTSADVLHAFWVPALGFKRDAIPGYVTETWAEIDREGIFRGQCAELCGTWHARMPLVVEAVSSEQFDSWVKTQKQQMVASAAEASADTVWSKDDLMAKGKEKYDTICGACHQVTGEGLPPAFPALKGSKIATGDVAAHLNIVLNGKPGTAMAAWNSMNDLELAAIITYERNAWGNNTGDVVQPADVKAAR